VSGRLAMETISPRVVRSASVAGSIFVEVDIIRGFLWLATGSEMYFVLQKGTSREDE
jgi:hypothetical protein